MPGYNPPENTILREFTRKLSTYYKGTNPERKADIAFIEKMASHSPKALLGAYVLKMKKTEYSYDTLSSNLYGKFFKNGSEFHSLLKNVMNLDGMNEDKKRNDLDDKQCLIYLNHLAKDLKNDPINNDAKSTKALSDEIKSVTDGLLKRLAPIIENTLKRPPTQHALLESFTQLPEAYKLASRQDSFFSSLIGNKDKHEQYADFIKITHELGLTNPRLSGESDNIKWAPSYTIPYSILLFVRNKIAAEYKLRSAKNNSRLHDLCEKALNLQSNTVVPNEIQNIYFSDLRSLIARLKHNDEYIAKYEKAGLKNAKAFFSQMERDINEELTTLSNNDKKQDYKATTQLSNMVAWTAQFGFSIISGNVAAQLFPKLSENVIKEAIGLVGLIYYGKSGKNIFSQIGGALESKMLGAVAGVFCSVLDPVGTMVGYLAGEALGVIISVGEKGVQYITFNPSIFPKNLDVHVPETEWLQTLYDVLPDDKKQILLRVTHSLTTDSPVENASPAIHSMPLTLKK